MTYLKQVWVCKVCTFQDQLGNLPEPHSDINACPKCKERGEFNLMVTVEQCREEQRKEKLQGQIYCRDCGNMGPIESFPFDAPEDDDTRERRCPQCGSDNCINASLVRFCSKCGEIPATEGEQWCSSCTAEYDEELEAAYQASQDLEYPD